MTAAQAQVLVIVFGVVSTILVTYLVVLLTFVIVSGLAFWGFNNRDFRYLFAICLTSIWTFGLPLLAVL